MATVLKSSSAMRFPVHARLICGYPFEGASWDTYNCRTMVRKRIPGHLHRTSNRKRGSVSGSQPRTKTSDEGADPHAMETDVPTTNGGMSPQPSPQFLSPATQQVSVGTSATGRVRPTQRGSTFRAVPRVANSPDLQADYDYVVHDLRQIGILTAMAVVVLIGLTFVIR